MSVFRIQFRDGKKFMLPVRNQEEYKDLRSSSKQLDNLSQARQGKSGAKMRLEQFNYSCLPNADGSLRGSTLVGNSVGMDIDHIAPEVMEKTIEGIIAKKDELGLMMLERSARGEGLHVVFRRHKDMNNEQNLRWASDLLGVEFDQAAKDITRIFFATSSNANDLLFLSDELFDNSEVKVTVPVTEPATKPVTKQVTEPVTKPATEPVQGNNDAAAKSTDSTQGAEGAATEELSYMGIPYKDIIKRWWKMYNGGREPFKSNRNSLIYELAYYIRNICGYDRDLLDKVIPCYDGFPQDEKMRCIDNALSKEVTMMPPKLEMVLDSFDKKPNPSPFGFPQPGGQYPKGRLYNTFDANGKILNGKYKNPNVESPDCVESIKALPFGEGMGEASYSSLPPLPQGVSDSVDAAGHDLALPALLAIAPAIGALATRVRFFIHDRKSGLNIFTFIVGDYASGKGQLDDVDAAWTAELQAEADNYTRQEEAWAQKARCMKSGKTEAQPKFPVRILTLNNTVANIAQRLANTDRLHSFSFTPEADTVAQKWKQTVSDFSVILRQAYDGKEFSREAKSADAVSVHIKELLWNVVLCGTRDALYRVIPNVTDGLLSRFSLALMPDNTYTRLAEHPAFLTDLQSARIKQIAHLLPLMEGDLKLPKLEQRGRKWLDDVLSSALYNGDDTMAHLRMRGCVNAERITVALSLPRVVEALINEYGLDGAETFMRENPGKWMEMLQDLQDDDMMKLFDIIADYLLDNYLYLFRDRIEMAANSSAVNGYTYGNRTRSGRNDSIFARLPAEFTFQEFQQIATDVAGPYATRNRIIQMLKNWKAKHLIYSPSNSTYCKVQANAKI